jgi:hypothetical protein
MQQNLASILCRFCKQISLQCFLHGFHCLACDTSCDNLSRHPSINHCPLPVVAHHSHSLAARQTAAAREVGHQKRLHERDSGQGYDRMDVCLHSHMTGSSRIEVQTIPRSYAPIFSSARRSLSNSVSPSQLVFRPSSEKQSASFALTHQPSAYPFHRREGCLLALTKLRASEGPVRRSRRTAVSPGGSSVRRPLALASSSFATQTRCAASISGAHGSLLTLQNLASCHSQSSRS